MCLAVVAANLTRLQTTEPLLGSGMAIAARIEFKTRPALRGTIDRVMILPTIIDPGQPAS